MLLTDTVMDTPKISLEVCSQDMNPSELLECFLVLTDYVRFVDKSVEARAR